MMNSKTTPSRRRSVNSEFERETKLIVLNFMGLVPASCPATADVYDTVTVDVSSEEEEEDMQPGSHGAVEFCELQNVAEESIMENCSVVTRITQNGALSSQHYTELSDSEGVSSTEIVVDACITDRNDHSDELSTGENLCVDFTADSASDRDPSNSASQLLQIPSSSRSPSPSGPLVERQSSLRSTTSSRRSSPRSGSINVQQADVETLVKTHSLPPLVIPLRDEITHEVEVLGQGQCDGNAAQAVAQSPETEVADMLRSLGDHVNEEFSEILSQAVAAVLPQQAANHDIPYAALQSTAASLIANVHGWSQVAMVLLFSQRLAFSLLSQGHSRIGNLADNTTQFIEDHVADFIIRNGGWQSILDMEVSDLLADRGTDDVDDCRHISPLRQTQSDAATIPDAQTDSEFIPDSSNVPSSTNDAGSVQPDAQHTDAEAADSDSDIFMYVALSLAVMVVVSAFYSQVLKK